MANAKALRRRRRLANWPVIRLLRLGIPLINTYLLTVEGRKTGQLHTIPLSIVEYNGDRYLVGSRGETNWVKNVRAAGKVTISRGRRYQVLPVTELDPADAAPVLHAFANQVPFADWLLGRSRKDSVEQFREIAQHHPVFKLEQFKLR
jgi:deazaflavin-dependent oxidoreductase (nitroreductase family)